MFYIVLTLEGYFAVTGARLEKQPEIPSDIRAHSRLDRKKKILNNYINYFARDGDKIPD